MTNSASTAEPYAADPARLLEWTARSAAHDLANQLLAIQWSSSLLDESREEPAAVRELAQEIGEAVGRARGVLSFLSLLVSPAHQAVPGTLGVHSLLHHAAGLIRLALGSEAGLELDLGRCASCRLGVGARGFVLALVRLATHCAELRPGAVLTLAAETSRRTAAVPAAGWLRVAIRLEPRALSAASAPTAEADADQADLVDYVSRCLDGELTCGPGGWELRIAAVLEPSSGEDPGGPLACESSPRGCTAASSARREEG
jgi:hypothetical protein